MSIPTTIYLTTDCLIGDRTFFKGEIVELDSTFRARTLVLAHAANFITDAVSSTDTDFQQMVIEHLKNIESEEATALLRKLESSIPVTVSIKVNGETVEPENAPKAKKKKEVQ